jgi:predicted O-linked N-acetylglucosamine transferase (SPINDLY family)
MPELSVAQPGERAAACLRAGNLPEAEALLRQVLRAGPGRADAWLNLGTVLILSNRLQEAASALTEAVRLRPDSAPARSNLGHALRRLGRPEEAADQFRKAVELDPRSAAVYAKLGSACRELGDIEQAVDCFHKALEIEPDYREAHSNLVYALHFHPGVTPEQTFQEHLRWAERFSDPLLPSLRPHPNDPDPDRRLRVGFVSPNLNHHVVGYFMEPILRELDRSRFEAVCYAEAAAPDDHAQRLGGYASLWRQTKGLSDEVVAQQVRYDRIDILVDLALHMAGNRLGVFALKPAPVQATYLAYCGTSGMRQMDYCLTDEHLAPEGRFEQLFTERLVRLPDGYWCYSAPPASPDVAPLPALAAGHVTFGSLNSFAKHNGPVLEAWGRVLQAVPGSRLVLHATGGATGRPSLPSHLRRHGLPPDRVDVVDYIARADYLAQYNRIDIALDPFSYNGGTTSLDALWMGVPVVTLAGQTPLGRAGVTILSRLGLTQLIAETTAGYVDAASRLAADLQALSVLRSPLRERLKASSLMDAPAFTRGLESTFRDMWHNYCRSPQRPWTAWRARLPPS